MFHFVKTYLVWHMIVVTLQEKMSCLSNNAFVYVKSTRPVPVTLLVFTI
jgi:hypothetical protein